MSGRFAQFTPPDRLASLLDAVVADEVVAGWRANWNLGPTDVALGLATEPVPDGGILRTLDPYRLGLVRGGRRGGTSSRLVDARAETVSNRSSFAEAFGSRRSVVPVDGFYEWRRGPGSRRQPHYFSRRDGAPMLLAAVWERRPTGPTEPVEPPVWRRSCAIVSTGAGPDMEGIHHRMPVVLEPETLRVWLDPAAADRGTLQALLRPGPTGTLVHHPVATRVTNPGADGPDLIAPAGPDGRGAAAPPRRHG